MAKRKTYAEILEQIAIPENTPETITCRLCGEPMHLLKINPYVAFWIHKKQSIIKCGQANDLHPGRPMIAQNMKFYKGIIDVWNELIEDRKHDSKN